MNDKTQRRFEQVLEMVRFETISQRSEIHNRNAELTLRTVATIALAGAFLPTALEPLEHQIAEFLLQTQVLMAIALGLCALVPRRGLENNIQQLESELGATSNEISRVYVARVSEVLNNDKKILRSRNWLSLASICLLGTSLLLFGLFPFLGA